MPIMISNKSKVKFDSLEFRKLLEKCLVDCNEKEQAEFILDCIESEVADFLGDAREKWEID